MLISCTNPFAPKLVNSNDNVNLVGDQKTIDGVFQKFRYSYMFKDTVAYGELLADDFAFVFRDYNDGGVDVTWGRQQDMLTTYRLFNATQNLYLTWNDIFNPIGDSLRKEVSRGFTLSIVFNPTDLIEIQGRAVFQLARDSIDSPWKIRVWRDESNF
jgi:hypothetical protein